MALCPDAAAGGRPHRRDWRTPYRHGLLGRRRGWAGAVRLCPHLASGVHRTSPSGLGASVLYVGAAKIMAQWFRSSEFGTLTGAWTSVANLGGLTAAAPLMALITLAGWRFSLGSVGLVILATAFLVYIFVRNSPSERGLPSLADIDGLSQSQVTSRSMPLREGVLVVVCEPNTWLLGGYAFLLFGTMTMMQGLWAVPYLMDAYGQTQQQAANALTLWAIGLIIGCTLWGYMADKIVGSRKCVVLAGALVYALLLGASRYLPRRIAGSRAVGGDVLGWLFRLD